RRLTRRDARISGLTWPLTSWIFEELYARNGVPLLDHGNGRSGRPTRAAYLDPVGVTILTTLQRMTADGVFADLGRAWDPAEQSFLAGRSAMLITSTSDVRYVTDQAPFKVE